MRRPLRDPRLALVPSDLVAVGELGLVNVWRVWSRLAGRDGFEAGDVANVRAIAWRIYGDEVATIALEELPVLLDELEADARSRRPMFVQVALEGGQLAIVFDPDGWRDNLEAAVRALRDEARAAQQRHLARRVDELGRGPDRPASRIQPRDGKTAQNRPRNEPKWLTEGPPASRFQRNHRG